MGRAVISDAIVLGAIDCAVYRDSGALHAIRIVPNDHRVMDCSRQVALILDSGAEQRRLPFAEMTYDALVAQLRLWSAKYRVLSMLVAGMDTDLPDDTRRECLAIAERLLRRPGCARFARSRLFGCPVPVDADVAGAQRLAFDAKMLVVAALYRDLESAAPFISVVRRMLDETLYLDDDGAAEPDAARRAIVDAGIVAESVRAIRDQEPWRLHQIALDHASDLETEGVPQAADVLTRFISRIEISSASRRAPAAEVDLAALPKTLGKHEAKTEDPRQLLEIGRRYDTTYGTLWKDGTYFPRGTRVLVTGLHLEQGFCVRFPTDVDDEPLETWEDWDELDFLAQEGSVESSGTVPPSVLREARAVLDAGEHGDYLHVDEGYEST
jgi:hypothetical protein